MAVYAVVTHQLGRRPVELLLRCLDSLAEQASTVSHLRIGVLLQCATAVPEALRARYPTIAWQTVPRALPAATARNEVLRSLVLADDDHLFFPDDDAWYPHGSVAHLVEVSRTRAADVLFVWYDDEPATSDARLAARYEQPSAVDVMRRSGMITIVLTGRCAKKVGLIDERLGLGSPLPGGEDADYAFRAYKAARRALMTRTPLFGHRSLTRDRRSRVREMSRYWPGVMFATLKHLRPSLVPLAAYRLAAGGYLVATGRLPIRSFVAAFAMKARRAEP